jgi:hypothetical protein
MAGRTARNVLLLDEVRWRLFRDDEMPARFQRLRRMERAARSRPTAKSGAGR